MYILNKEPDEILNNIKEKLNNFDELFISVSFITFSGFKKLFDLKKINNNIKIITTTDEYITDPNFLNWCLKNNVNVKLINEINSEKSFHSKFIIARKGNKYFTIIGSLNITNNSLSKKFESIYVSEKYEQLIDQFEYLWQIGKTLTNDYLINEYEEKFNRFNKIINVFKDNLIKDIEIKENQMQNKVLEEISNLRIQNENLALLHSATGTGKTYLSAFDIKKRGYKKVLFIVHNRIIIKSAMRDYRKIFYKKNFLELKSNNFSMIENSDFIFTTEKTIKKILNQDKNWLNKFDYFVFDEAHKIGKNNNQGEIFSIVKKIKNKFILGMTATPNRTDDTKFLIKSFDYNVVGNINLEKALENKLICDFKYDGVDIDVNFNVKDISEFDLKKMVDVFILKVNEKKVWDDTKIKGIIFTKNIKEANIVSKLINENGKYVSSTIHSNKNIDFDIEEYINRLQNDNNELNFLITVNMFNEGIDIPRVNTIGLFRFTESSIIYAQQIGRGLRKENSSKKYLNIIDLVGNYENNYQRIAGLIGEKEISPREIIDRIITPNKFLGEFNLTEISKQKIFDSLGKVSFKKYFDEYLFKISQFENRKLKLWEFEKELKETIQIISNNFRDRRTLNNGDFSWIINAKKSMGIEINLPLIENQIIELFSWMPITTSTSKEKKIILNLLNGKNVNLSKKWRDYFYGYPNNEWRFIHGDFTNFFTINNDSSVRFNMNLISKLETIEILKEISEYLLINLERNDKLKNTWYSKFEILFMAGKTQRSMEAICKVIDDENIEKNSIFFIGQLGKEYKNTIEDKNKYLISTRVNQEYDVNNIYYSFIGGEAFHKNELFMFVGKQSKKIIKSDSIKIEKSEKYYNRYLFESEIKISNVDYQMLKINTVL